jgi:6-phosphofructo-2-kinase/fructose-2,6-biphosphatase 4
MAAQLYKTSTGRMFHAGNIAVVTVGLPARGKTYLAHKLSRYFRWLGVQTSFFSVGDYRRQLVGNNVPHNFFTSSETAEVRESVANKCLDDLIKFLKEDGGQVAIYDAANTEESRREFISTRLKAEGIHVLYIEAICNNVEIIQANIREVKLSSPDYVGIEAQLAYDDFVNRIKGYVSSYISLSDANTTSPYIKVINVGEQIVANRIQGYLQTRIVYYLMNLHIMRRRIYFTRNGESTNETAIRSDAPLSPSGQEYSQNLPSYLNK